LLTEGADVNVQDGNMALRSRRHLTKAASDQGRDKIAEMLLRSEKRNTRRNDN
jgi:hypothetical protein